MGYFEALTSGAFKMTKDGQRLFFPWGTAGRGYVIPSDDEFRRLHSRVKAYIVVVLPVAGGAVTLCGFLGAVIALVLLVVPYIVWARMQCRHLQQASENLTLGESIAGQAREYSIVTLWALETGSLLFVAAGLFILFTDPASWVAALAAVGFFGVCALMFARVLIVKRRMSRPDRS